MLSISPCNNKTIFYGDNYIEEELTEKETVSQIIPPINIKMPIESVVTGKDSRKRLSSTTPNLNRNKSTNFRGQQQSTRKRAHEKMVELHEQEIKLRQQEIEIKWKELQLRQEEIQIKKQKSDNITSIADSLKIIVQNLK